jgi:hypothetical protein
VDGHEQQVDNRRRCVGTRVEERRIFGVFGAKY